MLLCANCDGSEKLPPLVIGKFENPRCFKNLRKKPCVYKNNKKAWMTSKLFEEWVRALDAKMGCANRKILLLLDRCPAHPQNIQTLRNVTIKFLPANCTSKLQPLDLGIIHCVKVNYRKSLIRKLLICVEQSKALRKINVLEAMYMVCAAWDLVSRETIENCFRKAGIVKAEICETETEEGPEEVLPDDWKLLTNDTGISLDEFYQCDEDLLITDIRDVEEIFKEENTKVHTEEDEDDVEQEDESVVAPPSFKEAVEALNVLQRYVIASDINEGAFELLESLENKVMKSRPKKKQTSILNYFKK